MPRISVVMPVHNAGPYLGPALNSLFAQSLGDFEIVAVDDGSTDGSSAVLAERAAADPRLRVVTQANAGVTPSLNRAIAEARGTYLARMDADDIALPERFARQVAWLDAHPETVALGTQIRLIDPEGRVLRDLAMPTEHDEIDALHASGEAMSQICHPTVMMRADAVRDAGGYDTAYRAAQDIDLFLRLAERGRLENLDTALLLYRQHTGSVGYARRALQRRSAWEAARAAAGRRERPFQVPPPGEEGTAQSSADVLRKWGWWALGAGEVATARHYARRAVMADPARVTSWKLAAAALRGY